MVSVTESTRPPRQEQEPADETVAEVAPGVVRMQLPIQLPGLGHVNCYALEDDDGFTVVDPGLPGPGSWAALVDRLGQLDAEPRHVHTVVCTHSHPDHHGGAHQLRAETGARIVTHRLFRNWWQLAEHDHGSPDGDGPAPTGAGAEAEADEQLGPRLRDGTTPWGTTWQRPAGLRTAAGVEASGFGAPTPTTVVDDADTVVLGGREWVAVHTPGHTPDHLCLFDPAAGVLLSGDHVLPTITPHISGMSAGPDPLRLFFTSLARMHDLDGVTIVLPAHGHPFADLAGRADAIVEHHEERLEALRRSSAELGPATVEELMQQLFRSRSWGQMAESETFAHLEHLRLAGEATRSEAGGRLRYLVG